eukprot:m.234891 g.234891  ORF g.234891 m.234891 type:complete len:446 (+) comp40122_c1_seq3:1824-3161(+)
MSTEEKETALPLFRDIQGEVEDQEISEIESLCMNCEENGTTRVLLTRIPMFKEIVVTSFSCPHCGWNNNEVQSAESIQDKGCKITLKVMDKKDLSRQIVRTDTTLVTIPELELEIPAKTQKGDVTTIESILLKLSSGLEKEQPLRKAMDPASYEKIEAFIARVRECESLQKQFTLIIDDPSGNSFVENPIAPQVDPQLVVEHYDRTKEQDEFVGIFREAASQEDSKDEEKKEDRETEGIGQDEVLVFAANCPSCQSPSENRMKVIDIPHFKQVVIMALTCDVCGLKSNEVKSGSGIADKGIRIELQMTTTEDLSRDVLKSETAYVKIPDIDLEVQSRSIGGRFTTVEGMIVEIRDELRKLNPFGFGDSAQDDTRLKLRRVADQLDKIASGDWMVKIVIEDPAGNSYMQNYYAPDPDPNLTVTTFQRDEEQNEDLGLTDMKTENYD